MPFSYQITASANPVGYGASSLPPGLAVNSLTGLISGTPTQPGTYSLIVSATFITYARLYSGKGSIAGCLQFDDVAGVSDFDGSLIWSKPASLKDALYPDGFAEHVTMIGSKYKPAAPGTPLLTLAYGTADFSAATPISSFSQAITFTVTNQIVPTAPNPEALHCKITPSTGLFTGGFTDPAKHVHNFGGALFQKQNEAAGLFLGSHTSGGVLLH